MYLLQTPWSRQEIILFALLPTLPIWLGLYGLLFLLGQNELSLELGIGASGFIALGFAGSLALALLLLRVFLDLDIFFYWRKIAAVSFYTGLLTLPLAPFFPANFFFASTVQFLWLCRKAPSWRQTPGDESPRLEPVFFAAVGIKIIVATSLLFSAQI